MNGNEGGSGRSRRALTVGRWAQALVLVVAFPGAVALDACGSSSPATTPPVCSDGSVRDGEACVPVAPDAAEGGEAAAPETGAEVGGDSAVDTGDAGDLEVGADAGDALGDAEGPADAPVEEAPVVPPVFGGVSAVAPASATQLFVAWSPGTDPTSPTSPLTYRVYVGPGGAPLSYATPALVTPSGAVSALIGGLQTSVTYKVAVRAVNAADVDDGNTVELEGTPSIDTIPPTFSGVQSAGSAGAGAVVLGWAAAHDDLTPVAAITYAVYVSDTPGNENFSSPTLVTPPGAVSAMVTRLPFATEDRYFVVRAQDASGNKDTNTVERSAKPGPDVTSPVFGGCTSAMPVASIAIEVAWAAATDDVSLPPNIAYDVFESTTSGQFDFTKAVASVVGQTSVTLAPLDAQAQYYFVCRARDEAGNEDGNSLQVSAMTGNLPMPPTFAGITGFQPDPVARTVTISWASGSDAQTPAAQLLYEVYESTTAGGESFASSPLATSQPGATSITVENLPAATTLYFVVRARDVDGEEDSNTVEQSFTTNLSFALNVQPIFTQNCGVVGCHVPGNPTGGLILAPGFAFTQTVNVVAGEATSLPEDGGPVSYSYVNPGDPLTSFLNIKINQAQLTALAAMTTKSLGTPMPAQGTGTTLTQADLNTIATWITQGAPNN